MVSRLLLMFRYLLSFINPLSWSLLRISSQSYVTSSISSYNFEKVIFNTSFSFITSWLKSPNKQHLHLHGDHNCVLPSLTDRLNMWLSYLGTCSMANISNARRTRLHDAISGYGCCISFRWNTSGYGAILVPFVGYRAVLILGTRSYYTLLNLIKSNDIFTLLLMKFLL